MSYFNIVEAAVEFDDGRIGKSHFVFKTPFILSENKHRIKFIANAMVNRYPHFRVQHKSLMITLDEYNLYNSTNENKVTLIDTRNAVRYKISKIKQVSFEVYTQLNNLLDFESFSIEVRASN